MCYEVTGTLPNQVQVRMAYAGVSAQTECMHDVYIADATACSTVYGSKYEVPFCSQSEFVSTRHT